MKSFLSKLAVLLVLIGAAGGIYFAVVYNRLQQAQEEPLPVSAVWEHLQASLARPPAPSPDPAPASVVAPSRESPPGITANEEQEYLEKIGRRRKGVDSLRKLAVKAGAETLAPESWAGAEALLAQANEEFAARYYEEALTLYRRAAMAFTGAELMAKEGLVLDEKREAFERELAALDGDRLAAHGGRTWVEIASLVELAEAADIDTAIQSYRRATGMLQQADAEARHTERGVHHREALDSARAAAAGSSWPVAEQHLRRALLIPWEDVSEALGLAAVWIAAGQWGEDPVELPLPGDERLGLCWVPPGRFVMGSDGGEPDEAPPREVVIDRGFWMGCTEVTVGQHRAITGSRKHDQEDGRWPVADLPWYEAGWFCEKLGRLRGLTVRLPTEAEWEYACRAGTESAYSFGDDPEGISAYGRTRANAAGKVGTLQPNPWGLYDMHGNVMEWCSDVYAEGQDLRVVRGGGWRFDPALCRSAARYRFDPALGAPYIGVRILITSSYPPGGNTR